MITYTASMGRKKVKQNEVKESLPVQEVERNSTEEKFSVLENKLEKLLKTVSAMEGRMDRDEGPVREISPVPSAHSSLREPRGASDQHLPTFDELRSDDRIQMEVQRKLHQYDQMSRMDLKGKNSEHFKSGRYRPGYQRVKKIIMWPQDQCTVVGGSRQPTYDDLSVYQWSQGYIQSVLEESNEKLRKNMLKHFVSMMQDSIELSFSTAKRAHGLILQEMEKGNVDWANVEKIEKIRGRNTQRVWQPENNSSPAFAEKTMLCKLYNKGTCRHDKVSEHVEKGVTYQHYCSNCHAITGRRFEHPRSQCIRLKADKKEPQTGQRV